MTELYSFNLCKLFVISWLFAVVCGLQDISNFVTTTDLGHITYDEDISDLRILKAFVELNPELPEDLKTTSQNHGAELYVTVKYPDSRAIIGVTGFPYCGYVPVTFNGASPEPAIESFIPNNSCGHSRFKRGYGERVNISTLRNLNRSLGRLSNTRPKTIKQAFVLQNNLSHDLIDILKVDTNPKKTTNSQARLYVPEGNVRYLGDVVVFFSA